MVHTCVAVGCSNRKEPGSSISFYRFPRDSELRRKWIKAVKRKDNWMPNDGSRLCSQHFIAGRLIKANAFSLCSIGYFSILFKIYHDCIASPPSPCWAVLLVLELRGGDDSGMNLIVLVGPYYCY